MRLSLSIHLFDCKDSHSELSKIASRNSLLVARQRMQLVSAIIFPIPECVSKEKRQWHKLQWLFCRVSHSNPREARVPFLSSLQSEATMRKVALSRGLLANLTEVSSTTSAYSIAHKLDSVCCFLCERERERERIAEQQQGLT